MNLRKGIGLAGVFSIATGAMISSGIFILPGLAFARVGSGIVISYFLAGVLALLGVFSVIELSTAMPKAGGDYYYVNRTFGPLLGTISGLVGWLAMTLKSAFAVFGIAEVLFVSFGFPLLVSSAVLCVIFLFVSLAGVKQAAVFQTILVAGLLGVLGVFVVAGLPSIDPGRFTSLGDAGINNIVITSGFIFISFGGLLKVATVSEEVVNPKRNIPLGMISSIVLVTVLYSLIVVVVTGTLDPATFSGSLTPIADSANRILGSPGFLAILIASMLAFVTTANAGLMSAARYPVALGRDGLIPPFLAHVTSHKKTPALALVVTTVMIYSSQLLPLEALVKTASTVILTSYVLTNLSVIVLRESKLSNYQPSFRAPFYPWLQIVCVALFGFFIIDLGAQAIEISLATVIAGLCLYFFYGRKGNKSTYALLHLLKRITDKRLTDDLLEDELREILISRDGIEQDSFDRMVRAATITDVEGPLDFHRLLSVIARDFAQATNMSEEDIIQRFMERQQECNSAVSDFLAIPHILLDGEVRTVMHVVRCKEGVRITEKEAAVKAVFFLGGTRDARVLHLKTIASLATMVSQSGFQEQWLKRESTVELKNLMMLNKRLRFF